MYKRVVVKLLTKDSGFGIRKRFLHEWMELRAAERPLTLSRMQDSGIAFISFGCRNIFNGDLCRALRSLSKWKEGKGLILYSNGTLFKNGRGAQKLNYINLKEYAQLMDNLLEIGTLIRKLPLVSAAFLDGKSSGLGTELLLMTDFRIMTANSEIHFDQTRFGLPPLSGGASCLQTLVGYRQSLQLLLKQRAIRSGEAMRIGLADLVVQGEGELGGGVEGAELWLSEQVSNEDPTIVQAVKRIVTSTRVCTHLDDRSHGGQVPCQSCSRREGSERRKFELDLVRACLHGQPHLTAMGLYTEPMFAHLSLDDEENQSHQHDRIMGGNANDDFIV